MRISEKQAWTALALAASLLAMPAVASAQNHDDHRDDRYNRQDNRTDNNHGRPDWHFDQNSRGHWNNYYRNDAMRWRNRRDRPNFSAGYVIPRNYAIQPVPRSYWSGAAAPPPGYQYGYYDGYVVAYNPTTRIVADAVDLVAGLAGH